MSKIKVGDTVWAGPCVVTWAQDGYASTVSIGNFGAHVDDDYLIPDVPGLAALAAVVAEVGVDRVSEALAEGIDAIGHRVAVHRDAGYVDVPVLLERRADMLRRLDAALEVKS